MAGVMLLSMAVFAGCGKKCDICGDRSMSGESGGGYFVCDDCLDSFGGY